MTWAGVFYGPLIGKFTQIIFDIYYVSNLHVRNYSQINWKSTLKVYNLELLKRLWPWKNLFMITAALIKLRQAFWQFPYFNCSNITVSHEDLEKQGGLLGGCGGARETRVTKGWLFPARDTIWDLPAFQDFSGSETNLQNFQILILFNL